MGSVRSVGSDVELGGGASSDLFKVSVWILDFMVRSVFLTVSS